MEKFKLLLVGEYLDENIFIKQELEKNDYEVLIYDSEIHPNKEYQYKLILFNINSNVVLNSFLNLTSPLGNIPLIFLIPENISDEKIIEIQNIDSYGYIPIKSDFKLLDIAIQNAIKSHSKKANNNEILTKLNSVNSIYELLLQISTLYLGKSHSDDEIKINKSLELMGKFVNADRSYIFTYDWKNNTTSNTFEWCNSGISSEIHNLQNVPCDLIPDWVNTHKSGKKLIIENVQILNDEDELKKILDPQGIKSLITVPIIDNNICKGFVGFDYVNSYSNISQKEYDILNIYTNILNSLETRKRYESELLKLNQELELRVVKKTKEIIKKEKIHSIVLKQHIVDLEEILFNLSHKLRHPVVKILGLSQLIDPNHSSVDELYEYVGYIKQSAEALDSFTRELTDLTHERKNRRSY
jgi:hypothetical protein